MSNINLEAFNFNKELTQLITKYGEQIPISFIYFILKDIFKDIQRTYIEYTSLLQVEKETEKIQQQIEQSKNNQINIQD